MALSNHKPQTVAGTLELGTQALSQRSVSARADAQILLAFTLGRERNWLIAHGEAFLSRAQTEKYLELCRKRATGMPVAYITGFAGFYGREFAVNEHVLIPRPESEHLVEDAVEHLRLKSERALSTPLLTIFEAGIGSGAMGCSVLAEIPNAALEATDISVPALKVAEYNARRLNVHQRCKFYTADVLKPNVVRRYDVVLANLPYIPASEVPEKPDPVGFEPRIALDGGRDGLEHYRKLCAHVADMLRPGALVLLEAAPPTVRSLAELVRVALAHAQVEVRHDYAGMERYVWALSSPSVR